jgi:hypothetical protein
VIIHCEHLTFKGTGGVVFFALKEFQLNSVIYCHSTRLSFPGCVRFFVSPKRSALVRWTRATLGGPWRLRRRLHKSASITHRRPACNLFSCAAGANKLARLLCTRRFMRRPRRAKHVPRSLCPSVLDLAQPYRSSCPERV